MTFTRYFKLSSYFLIGSGFAAIAVTGAVDIFSLVLFSAVLVVSWFIDTERLRQQTPAWLLNSIALAYFPIYLLDYLALSRSFVLCTVHLIFFVATVKLLTRSTDRDYGYLYFMSFAELLAASTLTVDITFAILLFVFLLSGISTLVLFELRQSNARAQDKGKIQPLVIREKARGTGLELFSPFPAGSVLWTTLGMTLIILLLAFPLFLLIPRVSLGIYSRPTGRTQLVSGFSETVELGAIGTIKESDAVVMKVRLSQPPAKLPGDLKWRGLALDYYDGRAWSRSRPGRSTVVAQGEYYKLEDSALTPEFLWQTYYLEALSTNVVFVCHKVLAVSARDIGFLQRDVASNLFTRPHAFNKVRYSTVSEVIRPDPALIPAVPYPISEEMRETYLQLPPLDPRISELARKVTQTNPHLFGKAQLIEHYLRSTYGYSLELKGSPNSKDPIAMFLFDIRKGHCEYFASAMTIMLRQLAIPARLVNGFRAGEYNSLGDAWVVRQYDAHSWVEAYYPPYGWVEFDPTPPDPQRNRSAFLRMVSNLSDVIDLWWSDDVVNYTFWTQLELIRNARAQIMEQQQNLKNSLLTLYGRCRSQMDSLDLGTWLSSRDFILILILLVASGTTLSLLARYRHGWSTQISRKLRRVLSRNDRRYVISSLYIDALDLLQARGMTRRPSQTPLEFVHTLESQSVSAPMTALTQTYNRIRFGSEKNIEDLSVAKAQLQALRMAVLLTRRTTKLP